MMWPNSPSSLRQAHIRRIMQSKAARRPATAPVATMLASYDPSEGLTSHPDMEGVSVVQTMSAAGVSIIYLGSPDDTGVVSPEKTGAAWGLDFEGKVETPAANASMGAAPIRSAVEGVQVTPLVPSSHKPVLRIEGPASYPDRVIVTAKLRALRSQSSPALEPSQFGYILGYTGAIKIGRIPESLKFDLSTSGDPENPGSLCEYQNPCGSTLSGTLDVTPRLDRFNVNEIINRDWVPTSGVKLVCTLAPGQDAVQQCQP